MQKKNNIIKDMTPLVRLIILIFCVTCIIIARSIYLILFLTTLICIMCIITSKKVNTYVNFIKKILILLLFFLIVYIIMCREYNAFRIAWFLYKEFLIVILIKIYDINTKFEEFNEAISLIFEPFKHVEEGTLSYNISLSIYLIKFWIASKEGIRKKEKLFGIKRINFMKRISSRVIFTINELEKLQLKHKLNFYFLSQRQKRMDLKSKIVLMLFSLFFIICIFKEVIL